MAKDCNNFSARRNFNLNHLKTQARGQNGRKPNEGVPYAADEISRLTEWVRHVPDIRESKVELLRSNIRNGTYEVKAEKIADEMIHWNSIDQVR